MLIAAVQASPIFLDRAATLARGIALAREAAERGAKLIAFGEGFLPGHPIWYHVYAPTDPGSMRLAAALVDQAILIPGPETEALAALAQETGAMIVMGVIERDRAGRSVIFSSAVVATPDGRVESRRKLTPAVGERIVFTAGAGDGVGTFAAPWGGQVSVLLGGENSNPLLTYAMRSLGASVHVAAWPPFFNQVGVMRHVMTVTGAAVAYQNTAYVLAVAGAGSDVAVDRIARTDDQRELLTRLSLDGGSTVYAPRGRPIAGPAEGGDQVLYAEIDLSEGTWAQLVNRQYDRPDVLRLQVNRTPAAPDVAFAADHRDDAAAVRSMIRQRFGTRLSDDDVERLIPYVRAVLDRSAELEALDLTDLDPRLTTYADDPRRLENPGG